MADGAPGSIADEVARRRASRFVGREEELRLVDRALDAGGSAVLWVFGPGGVGKSSLLAAIAARARGAGVHVASVDLRAVEPTAAAVRAAVDAAIEPAGGARVALLLDTVEHVAGIEPWLRDELLGSMPTGTVAVVASRHAPGVDWRSDPAWAGLLRLVPLRNLAEDDASQLLRRLGVADDAHAAAHGLAGGHPLALALVADLVGNGGGATTVPDDLADVPDLLAELVARLVDVAPDEAHRRGLDTAALSRVTSRGLLRHVVGDAADDVFDWLRARPYVDAVPGGLVPHELARSALEAHLRWSDAERYAQLHHALREHAVAGLHTPGRRDASIDDLVFLHRRTSTVSGYWDWSAWGTVSTSAACPADADELAAIVREHDGEASVPILRHWLERMPERFTVVRRDDAIEGFFAWLVLAEPTDDDLRIDPGIAAVWEHASRNDPPRPGQVIGVNRFFADRAVGQGASATFNALTTASTRHWLGEPGLAWDYIACVRDRGYWDPMMAYLDFHPVESARFRVGDVELMVYTHDWRRLPPDRWLDLMEAREMGEDVQTSAAAPTLVALSRPDFAAAVKRALRDLARPDRLATNPLLGSRVAVDAGDPATTGTLTALLRDAFASLPDEPRTASARRALERTYLHGAVSQEAAAEVLGMAFSTYRRHLAAGTELLIDALWQWELFGRPA